MGQYSAKDESSKSGIKVLDRAAIILQTIGEHPCSLAELCAETGLPRATAHRLATALEAHRILARTADNRWIIGPMITALSSGQGDVLIETATPIMEQLLQRTGESVQLYRLTGTTRTCVASKEPALGLRNTVPIGARMPLTAGSAARIFTAFGDPKLTQRILPEASFTLKDLDTVRRQGFAESMEEREKGLASCSAPVYDHGRLVAALSISGPVERLRPSPGAKWAAVLVEAAHTLSHRL